MRIIPNSIGSNDATSVDPLKRGLREYNHCHSPEDGKFCSAPGDGGGGGGGYGTQAGSMNALMDVRDRQAGEGTVSHGYSPSRVTPTDAERPVMGSAVSRSIREFALKAGYAYSGRSGGKFNYTHEDGSTVQIMVDPYGRQDRLPRWAIVTAEGRRISGNSSPFAMRERITKMRAPKKEPRVKAPAGPPIEGLKDMSISGLARLVRKNWGGKVNYAAVPYLDAMSSLDKITDNYGADSGQMVVAYFLGNATKWHGDVAKQVKAELKRRLGRK